MQRNRKISWLFFAVCLVGLLSGCGKDAANTSGRNESIVIWAWDDTFNVKAAKLAAREYKKEYPQVEVIIETKEREEILADTKNLLSSKVYSSLPDIVLIEDYDIQDVLSVFESEFVDLTDEVDADKFVDYKSQLCSRDGHMYGVPFDSGVTALFYRVDILNRAGYTEADMQNLTWDRYIEIGEDVYQQTGMSMMTMDPTDMPQIRLMMQSCGTWYVKQDGVTADIIDNEALRQALEIYQRLLTENVGESVNGWNDFISAFQSGKVASVINGGWIISNIKDNQKQSGLWRIAPIPTLSENENATAAANVGGSSWYVLKNGHNPDGAVDFITSMFGENDAFMDSLISEIGIIPVVKDPTVYENYETEDPFFGGQQATKILTQMEREIPTVNYGSKTYEIEDILEEEFQDVLTDGDLTNCLEKVQMKAEAVAKE